MDVQAVQDKIIVKVQSNGEATKGGIIIPESAGQLPQIYGEVLSVGEKVTDIEKGQVIMFHQRAGQVIFEDNVEYRVVKNDEVYGYRR